MTGHVPEYVRRRLEQAADWLRAEGFRPVTPDYRPEENPKKAWADYMLQDLALLRCCDAILLLKGWRQSQGCQVEAKFAKSWGLRLFQEKIAGVKNC